MLTLLRRTALGGVFTAFLAILASGPAMAQGLLRDAGMEHALNILARPLLTAAGLPANRTKVMVVNEMGLNAFVANSRTIFINAGLLLRMQNADQLQAVIAHEVAHIANGHFARRGLNAQAMQRATAIGALVGVAAGAASNNPGAGAGVIMGIHSSARRTLFAHTREEEAAADKSGLRFLARAGIDPVALAEVMELFKGQEDLLPGRQDPYARTHPLSRDRVRAIRMTVDALSPLEVDRGDAEYWFGRAKALLSAYLRSPSYTLTRTKASDTSDAAAIGRALAYYKKSDLEAARAQVAILVERRPDDPYAQDLGGWIELESGHVQRAIEAYATAAELAPREPLILAGYGRALLAQNTKAGDLEALEVLEEARARDQYDTRMLRDLSVAYARTGNPGMASLATAERYALYGQIEDAAIHAHRAAGALPTGSPGWSRAQDVIHAANQNKRR
ncbi:M48 family metalloprotease [Fluviibacterium sp. DFM31]|uniref:M48 family metalloprotease n=1 Tax=Meridianimarinicoccus marinus TaxID=3231483 RepID=A0ABV3L460_9RHOB